MSPDTTIVWLRNDLRLDDNPALYHASEFAKKNNSKLSIIYIYQKILTHFQQIWALQVNGGYITV